MRLSRLLRTTILTATCVTFLAGCSWLGTWPPQDNSGRGVSAPPPPGTQQQQVAAAEQFLPPPQNNRAALDTSAARGLSMPQHMDERLAALENDVANLRNDISLMMPALTKLVSAQGEIQQLLGSLSGNLGNIAPAAGTPAAPPAEGARTGRAYAPATAVYQHEYDTHDYDSSHYDYDYQAAPESAPVATDISASAATAATGLRFGEHPDKTRLVIDVAEEVAFSYNVDNAARTLQLNLARAGWQGLPEADIQGSPNVASYIAAPDGAGGTEMAVTLKQPARIVWAQYLPPSGDNGPRIVVDIAPL